MQICTVVGHPHKLWMRLYRVEKSLVLAVMVGPGVADAHFVLDPL